MSANDYVSHVFGPDSWESWDELYRLDAALGRFFGASDFRSRTFPNSQSFDFEGLRGRLLSSSYAPAEGHPRHAPMLAALRRVFDAHAVEGRVSFDYDTELHFGRVSD